MPLIRSISKQNSQPTPSSYEDKSLVASGAEYKLSQRQSSVLFGQSGIREVEAGIAVTPESAMTHSAVYRCVSLLSSSIASCRADVQKIDREDGSIEIVTDHPAANILSRTPDFTSGLTPYAWIENIIIQFCLKGDSFTQVGWNARGQGVACYPLPFNWVTPEWDDNGHKIYKVHTDGYFSPKGRKRKADEILQVDEVIHLANMSTEDGLRGISPINRMAQEISLGLASTRHSARYFRHGRPLGFVSQKEWLKDKDKVTLQGEWNEMHRSPWSVGVLANDAKWVPLSLSAQEVQLIETREFQIADIARFFGVPSFLLGLANKEGYKSAEQLFRSFVTATLGPIVTKLEQELRLKLFTRDESFSYRIRFDMDDLQRGDTQVMAEALERQLRHGSLTVNEWRQKMGRNKVEGGDVPLMMASQLATLEDVINGTANLGKGATSTQGGSGKSDSKNLILTADDRMLEVRAIIAGAMQRLAELAI